MVKTNNKASYTENINIVLIHSSIYVYYQKITEQFKIFFIIYGNVKYSI